MHNTRAFTLIELLVVIAIIGLLSSVVLASLNSAREKSRDARRLADARQIERALELYYDDNDQYPDTGGSWQGGPSGCYGAHGFEDDGYIPGLVPDYMAQLPGDPTPNDGACYIYKSNGVDYKFLMHRTMETCTPGDCPLQDPLRAGQPTSGVYSPDASGW